MMLNIKGKNANANADALCGRTFKRARSNWAIAFVVTIFLFDVWCYLYYQAIVCLNPHAGNLYTPDIGLSHEYDML